MDSHDAPNILQSLAYCKQTYMQLFASCSSLYVIDFMYVYVLSIVCEHTFEHVTLQIFDSKIFEHFYFRCRVIVKFARLIIPIEEA